MQLIVYTDKSQAEPSPTQRSSDSLLSYGGKEAAILLAAALAVAIIIGAVTKLVEVVLHAKGYTSKRKQP